MSAESDVALVARLGAGDPEALALLYDRHAPVLLALAQRILGDEREAQDLLHDVFLEVWERARTYHPERGSVRTWLLIRMRSRAIDRKGSARLSRRVPAPEAEDDSRALHPAVDSLGTPDRLAVHAALDRLPVEVRQVLELSYFSGMTGPEIAKRVGVPEGTIRSRLARGLALLEQLLADETP